MRVFKTTISASRAILGYFVYFPLQLHVSFSSTETRRSTPAACLRTPRPLSWSSGSEWSFFGYSLVTLFGALGVGAHKQHCVRLCLRSRREVLHLSNNLDKLGPINWRLTLCLAVIWLICYFCVWKGVKSTGKVRRKASHSRLATIFMYILTQTLFSKGLHS